MAREVTALHRIQAQALLRDCLGYEERGLSIEVAAADINIVAGALASGGYGPDTPAASAQSRQIALEHEAMVALFQRRAALHQGEDGEFFFEVFGKPATVRSFKTVGESALAAVRALKLMPEEEV